MMGRGGPGGGAGVRFAFFMLGLLGVNVMVTGAAATLCAVRHANDAAASCSVELQACNEAASRLGATGLAVLGMSSLFAPLPPPRSEGPYDPDAPPDRHRPAMVRTSSGGQ